MAVGAGTVTEIRILTVRQPCAWAIIHGGKDVENRSRNLAGSYRGRVAIHVAGKYATEGLDLPALDDACDAWCAVHGCGRQHPWTASVGKIIGTVNLVDAHYSGDCYHASIMRAARLFKEDREEFDALPVTSTLGGLLGRASFCSPWAEDESFHLHLANPRPLAEPLQYRGGLGLRRFDDARLEGLL